MREDWKDNEEQVRQNMVLLEDEQVQEQFKGYYFDAGSVLPQLNSTQDSFRGKEQSFASSQGTADTAVVIH